MDPFEKILDSLAGIRVNPENRYIRDLENVVNGAGAERRIEVIAQVGEYICNPTLSQMIPSGVSAIDSFLRELSEVSARAPYVQYRSVNTPRGVLKKAFVVGGETAHDKASALKNAENHYTYARLLSFAIHDLSKEDPATAITYAVGGAFSSLLSSCADPLSELDTQIRNLKPEFEELIQHFLDGSRGLEREHPLVQAYLEEKNKAKDPKQFCRDAIDSIFHRGKKELAWEANCPVESFSTDAKESMWLPKTYAATEFVYFIVKTLKDNGLQALAERTYQSYGWPSIPLFALLHYGKNEFDAFQNYTNTHCRGCQRRPTNCEFVELNLGAIVHGSHDKTPCPQKKAGMTIVKSMGALEPGLDQFDEETTSDYPTSTSKPN